MLVVDAFEDVVDMVVQCGHSVEPLFCGWWGGFVVVLDVYGVWIEAIETSV